MENQTESTLQFIDEIRKSSEKCKIEADIMPSTIKENSFKIYNDKKNTKLNISFDAITGTTKKNVHKKLLENDQPRENDQMRALFDLE